ncbi:retropepsin-like aspartic protease family protein [Prosthecomicrobium sp. N25]|uniref:retropepsin-like aspartic protease family protein n=1 Tax=Prosthecomicrobium sp. N25 TaxID=3129254 RepID=UPI0030784F95
MVQKLLRSILFLCFGVLLVPIVSPYGVDLLSWIADRPDGTIPTAVGYRAEEGAAGLRATGRAVSLRADKRGHFEVDARINGTPVAVMVDTGATSVALRFEDAARLGLRPLPNDFDVPIATANGTTRAARALLKEVRIGEVKVRDVEALIVPAKALNTNLLGMSFIKRLSKVELKGDRLLLAE